MKAQHICEQIKKLSLYQMGFFPIRDSLTSEEYSFIIKSIEMSTLADFETHNHKEAIVKLCARAGPNMCYCVLKL